MTGRRDIAFLALAAAFTATPSAAQDLFVYPAQGQSAEQTQKDQAECRQWAQQQSGVNPSASAPQQQSTVGRGIVGGALGGLIIGNVAGGSGSSGAAAGALMGGIGSGIRDSRSNQANQQAAAQSRDSFNRAYSLCLENRGYSVR